jgi:hypothetical protein
MDDDIEGSVEKRRRRPVTACENELGRGMLHEEARLGVDVPEFEDDVGVWSL